MSSDGWRISSGEDLVDLYHSDDLGAELPKNAAIYVWKLAMRPSSADRATGRALARWVDQLLTLPLGEVAEKRISHAVKIRHFELRGDGLGTDKLRTLARFASNETNRLWLLRYLEALSPYVASLYAGETGNLQARVMQHIRGDSDFGATVLEHDQLSWDMLDLHYVPIGPATEKPSDARKAIEYLTAVMTVSAYTQRPG